MTVPQADESLESYHNHLRAVRELQQLLQERRQIPLGEVERIASKHHIPTAQLLGAAEFSTMCQVDYQRGLVICK